MSLCKPTVFTGVATALLTPFCEGEIDYVALERMIEVQIDGGCGAILVAGTTGESATLSVGEHHALVSFAKKCIRARVPLLAGCGSNSTSHAIELAKAVCDAGADALLAVTPYYNKTNDRGILLHYRALADAATRPLMLYSVPSRTGYALTAAHCLALSEHPNIVAIKEAERCRLCAAGEYRAAGARERALLPRMNALFREVNPIPVKYVAAQKGMCRDEFRLPLCPPTKETARFLNGVFGLA